MKKIVILVFCFLGLLITAKAQLPDYHLQLFDYPTGILPNEIRSMTKDKQRMVWILYNTLVQRFDGKEVQNFRLPGQLAHLSCDSRGRIWVSSRMEVFLFSQEKGSFSRVKIERKTDQMLIGPVIERKDGSIYLLTSAGFYEFRLQDTLFVPLKNNPFARLNILNSSLINDVVFVNNDISLYKWNIGTGAVDSMPGGDIYGIYPITEDSILVTAVGREVEWYDFSRHRTGRLFTGHDKAAPFSIRGAASISPKSMLIASSEGIMEYKTDEKKLVPLKFFLYGRTFSTREYAKSIYHDKADGYIWLATTEGISRFSTSRQPIGLIKIKELNADISSNIDDIRQTIEDRDGNLWMASGFGLVSWQKNKNTWKLFPPVADATDRLAHESVRGFAYDGRYLLVGPTYTGLWLFDPKTSKYRRPTYADKETKELDSKAFINHINTLQNGDHIISANNAMYLLNGKTYELSILKSLPAERRETNFTVQDKTGLIWVGTGRGLYCMDASYRFLAQPEEEGTKKFITTGFVLPDNSLLFSFREGLYTARYENDKINIRKKSAQFDGVQLSTLYVDENDILWASSDNGIYRFDPSSSKLNLFDRSDNIQGYHFNSNSYFRDKDGMLYFGGINGINYWNPATFTPPAQSFEAYINEAQINNREYSMYTFGLLEPINYSESSIAVSFSAVYFNNPEKVSYRYKLEGLDDNWKDIGRGNVVQFSSLAPGKYTLHMQASLNQVDWKNSSNTLSFTILKPFWMTWWFISIIGVVIAAIFGLVLRDHRKKIKEHKEALETEQAINHFSASIYKSNSVDEILWDVVKKCISHLHVEDCIIYQADYERRCLTPIASYRSNSPVPLEVSKPSEIPLGMGITGAVALSGKSEIVSDTRKDNRYIVEWERRNSEITVPIVTDGKVWGIIDCEHSRKGFFKEKHLSILTNIAGLCANKIQKAKANAEKKEAEDKLVHTEKKMAEAEMQALRAQMNPHFIFNSLNSINRYIVKSDQATASLYLTRFAKLIRLILDNSNSKSITLTNEIQALTLYLEMESIRFEKKFTYNIVVDNNIDADNIFVPPLIIQPYAENAIWHGLLHKEDSGHLNIDITQKTEQMLQCIIEDDGIGREKARELKSKSASNKKSLGMKLTESRLGLLSKEDITENLITIEDIRDGEGKASGTRVVLNIPVE
ncbi:MAG: histidine kinase [Chitinophagaceae bacterium]|nr:histidine kinase [Chitinophagaceae bacterium]MCW5926391.1 histidine kinase [Chitinophagaceae bacterium]